MDRKEFQGKLDGVYDLNKVDDCQKVIDVLLRDLERHKGIEDAVTARLTVLAELIAVGSPDAKRKATEILAKQENRSASSIVNFLFRMADQTKRAENLDDKALLEELNRIWSGFPTDLWESAVLAEVVRRFEERSK